MKILFVCTANSCRSQMAEAWARHLCPPDWEIASGGLLTYPITDKTRAVMAEVGLDLAGQEPKTIDLFDLDTFDLIVTLSSEAGQYLPRLAHPERHRWHLVEDPMSFRGGPEETRADYRRGRDEIRGIVASLLPHA
jgi:arsenate reductase